MERTAERPSTGLFGGENSAADDVKVVRHLVEQPIPQLNDCRAQPSRWRCDYHVAVSGPDHIRRRGYQDLLFEKASNNVRPPHGDALPGNRRLDNDRVIGKNQRTQPHGRLDTGQFEELRPGYARTDLGPIFPRNPQSREAGSFLAISSSYRSNKKKADPRQYGACDTSTGAHQSLVSRPEQRGFMASPYDAIVIGGGHNGLTAAAYFAKAGITD